MWLLEIELCAVTDHFPGGPLAECIVKWHNPAIFVIKGNGMWSLRAVIARKSLRNAAGSGSGQRARMGASR